MDSKFFRNTKTEKHFGGGGNPHGTSLGLAKCTSKTETDSGVAVTFSGEHISVSATVNKEAGEGITVDGTYEVYLQTP